MTLIAPEATGILEPRTGQPVGADRHLFGWDEILWRYFSTIIRYTAVAIFFISAPKPIVLIPTLSSRILSKPTKAPPQIKRIFVVSICRNSC